MARTLQVGPLVSGIIDRARSSAVLIVLLALAIWLGCGSRSAFGQVAAHFSYTENTVATGLSYPQAVAVDTSGNVYIAGASTVIKETPDGSGFTATTVATGIPNPTGVAVDAGGNVYIAATGNKAIYIESPIGGVYTQTTLNTDLSAPYGIAVDSNGNLYISDTNTGKIIKETISSGVYSASTIDTLSNGAFGLTVDATGNVYIASASLNEIVLEKLSGTSYTRSQIGTGLSQPHGVAVDGIGNVYIANTQDNSILVETPTGSGYKQSMFFSSGLDRPVGIGVDNYGGVFIADTVNARVLAFHTQGTDFGSFNVGTTSSDETLTFTFDAPGMIGTTSVTTQGTSGVPFVDTRSGTCAANGQTHSYNTGDTCTIVVTFAPQYSGKAFGAATLADPDGNALATAYVAGEGIEPVVGFLPATASVLIDDNKIQFIFADGAGNLFYRGLYDASIMKASRGRGGYSLSQLPSITILGCNGLNGDLEFDGAGNIYCISGLNPLTLTKLTPSGGSYSSTTIASFSPGYASFAVDGYGNVFVATGSSIYKETLSNGAYIQTEVFVATLPDDGINNLWIDGNENIYFSSGTGIQKLAVTNAGYEVTQLLAVPLEFTSGYVDSVGNVYAAYFGVVNGGVDDGVVKYFLTSAGYVSNIISTSNLGLGSIGALAVDGNGNIYIGTQSGVAELSFSSPPSLSFASTGVGSTSSDSPQTVTMVNLGTSSLMFPVPPAGSNPTISPDFSVSNSSTCPQVTSTSSSEGILAPNSLCTFLVSYSPTTTGTTGGSLVLTDSTLNAVAPGYATQTIPLAVRPAVVLTPASLPDATVSASYKQALSASGGTGPYTYAITSGALPSGFNLSSTGLLTGNATQTSLATFTVTATDSSGAPGPYTGSQIYTLTVDKGTPVITWASPSPITVGTALSSTQLDATASVPGTFAYSPATGTVLSLLGTNTLSVTFTPTDTADYTTATDSVSINVVATQTPPVVTLSVAPSPSAVYGQTVTLTATETPALGLSQGYSWSIYDGSTVLVQNAFSNTISAAGNGLVDVIGPLSAGHHSLRAVFSSTTSGNPTGTSNAIPYNVAPAPLTVTAANANRLYGSANPTFSGTTTGAVNGDTFTVSASSSATAASAVGTYPIVPAASGTNLADYTVSNVNGTLTITPVALTVTAANATRIYGTPNLKFTGSASGAVNGDTFTISGSSSATTGSDVGTYVIVPVAAGTDLGDYTVTNVNGTLTITQAGSVSTLSSSSANVNQGAAVTFTANVTSATTGTPSGTVTFLDGTTTLGTGSLVNGVATFSTSSLAAGTHSITASYAASTDFSASTSAALSEVVVAPDFTLSVNPASLNINAGQSGTAVFTVTPVGGFTQAVQFSCSGLPVDASCTFSPSTVTPSGAPATTTLTIATDVNTGSLVPLRRSSPTFLAGFLLPGGVLLTLALYEARRRVDYRHMPFLLRSLLIIVGLSVGLSIAGCGSKNVSTPVTPPGTSSVSVTATTTTSGGQSHVATLAVTITN